AAFRDQAGVTRVIDPAAVRFTPLQSWTSVRSRATWPIAQRITVGNRTFETAPLMPDQELDSRLTTGAVYWEGASTLLEGGRPVGRGYLEMTGYMAPLRL
ncbi:MAG: lipocalin family protein, partial [Gammaproteobacteria bacterium]